MHLRAALSSRSMVQLDFIGFCALLASQVAAFQDVENGLHAHLDQFASRHLINGTVLAKPAALDERKLGYTFTLDCTVRKELVSYHVSPHSSGHHTELKGSCRLRHLCADKDLAAGESYTACTLSTKGLGYCDEKCAPVLACSASEIPETLAEQLNGYRLELVPNPERTKITNPSHLCSRPDRTETFTQAHNRSSSLLADFQYYSQYAAAAYCNTKITAGSPFACDGACPLIEASNSTAVETFTGEKTGVTGFIAVDHARSEVVLSVRGSWSWANWVTDAKFGFSECDLVDNCKVHSGFHQAWHEISLRAEAGITQVLAKHPGYSVVTTGHSLGGAVCILAAAHLRRDGMKVTAYTYGAPRVGNARFANFVNSQPGEVYRITHGGDPIPHLPMLSLEYAHTSPEYWIDKCGSADNGCDTSDVTVCSGIANPNCNTGTYGLEINAHSQYFGTIDACKPSLWSLFTSSTKRANQPFLSQRIEDMLKEDRQVAVDAAQEREAQRRLDSHA